MVCVCWQQQEWGKTLSSHRASVHLCVLSHVQLYVTLWTVALQALLSMGFSGQEYWSGFQFLLPGDLPYPWIGPTSPAPQGDSLMLSHQGSPISSCCAVAGLVTQSCPILCVPMDCSPPGSSVHGPSPGKNTGVGASSRGSSQARDETQVSCIAGRFFTIRASSNYLLSKSEYIVITLVLSCLCLLRKKEGKKLRERQRESVCV